MLYNWQLTWHSRLSCNIKLEFPQFPSASLLTLAFSALTLWVGHQEEHYLTCKKLSDKVLAPASLLANNVVLFCIV